MKRVALEQNVIVEVYDGHAEAEAAVRQLHGSGFEMKRVSVMARDEQNGEDVLGYYNIHGGPMRYWGRPGAFWSGLWEMLSGWAFFAIPDLGPVLVAGPLGGLIIAALDNRAIFAGLSAVGAGMYSIGIPWDRILAYEAALRAGKLLVVAHGSTQEVNRARAVLRPSPGSNGAGA